MIYQPPKSHSNYFSAGILNRASENRHSDEWFKEVLQDRKTLFVPVWKNKNLLTRSDQREAVFLTFEEAKPYIPKATTLALLGFDESIPYFLIDLPPTDEFKSAFEIENEFNDLRLFAGVLSRKQSHLLAYARALAYWHQMHQFCGACGNNTISKEAGHMRQCNNPSCGKTHYPRTDVAIIVLISFEDKCLLVRQPNWPPNLFALVAGFLEPCESLEDAVAREVMEETGIEITNIRYHSTQPWPFPSSIMVGFTATALNTTWKLQTKELEEAVWVSRKELIQKLKNKTILLPPELSISYRLIEDWFNKKNKGRLSKIIG